MKQYITHIQKVTQAINKTHDLEFVAQEVVDIMIEALDSIGGALFLVEKNENRLRAWTHSKNIIINVISLLGKPFRDYFFDLKEHKNFTTQAATRKKMFFSNDYSHFLLPVLSKGFGKIAQKILGMRSITTIPAIFNNEALGVLMIGFREKTLSKEKMDLIQIFADQCAVAINNAKKYQELENIFAQQSDFIAVTAHELRTPLNISIAQLEYITEMEKHTPEVKEELSTLESSLENLKELIQRLFTVQQHDLEKITLQKEKTHINKFITDIFNDFKLVAREKGFDYRFKDHTKENITIDIDQSQIRQLLHNIFTNAYKHTPNTKRIVTHLWKKKDDIVIAIYNDGKSIPDDIKQKIFEKFQTKKVTTAPGIGLGLYICRKIAELHNGKIWVENGHHEGSIFFVSIPIKNTQK